MVIATATLAASAGSGLIPAAQPEASQPPAGTAADACGAAAETASRAAKLRAEHDRRQLLEALQRDNAIYFDFDRSDIRDEGRPVISRFGSYLSGHPTARARVEGHTDERGSREYNVALGGRRSPAVRLALATQGGRELQLGSVSYGAERPAADGHDATAWAGSRRTLILFETPGDDRPTSR